MKKIFFLLMVATLLSACSTNTATTSSEKKPTKQEEAAKEEKASESKKENDGNGLLESISNKEKVVMDLGYSTDAQTYTQIDSDQLPFYGDAEEEVHFSNVTLLRPFEWSYEDYLSYRFQGNNGSSTLLITDSEDLAMIAKDTIGKTYPIVVDKNVLGAASFTSLDFGSFYLKKGEKGLDVFEKAVNANYPMGNIDISPDTISWMTADTNNLFVGFFDENGETVTKGFYRKSDEPNTTWTEVDVPNPDSEVIALGDKGYFVSLKEKAIMSIDKKGKVKKVTKLDSAEGNVRVDSFAVHANGNWVVSFVNQDEFGGIMETPNKLFTFSDLFMVPDFLSNDYFVTISGVVALLVNSQTGEYFPIRSDIVDIAATDVKSDTGSGSIALYSGVTTYIMDYKIN